MASDRIHFNDFIHEFQSQLTSAEQYHVGEWLREHLPYLVGPSITTFSPIAGGPGTVITVRGYQFANAREDNIVHVGGRPARVVTASPTELTVIAARDVADGPVTVTVGGRTASGPVNFDVTGGADALTDEERWLIRLPGAGQCTQYDIDPVDAIRVQISQTNPIAEARALVAQAWSGWSHGKADRRHQQRSTA